MIQPLLTTLIVAWSGWYVFGALAPWRQRRARAWLARQLDGRFPAALVDRVRPGLPALGCGCGTACGESGPSNADPQR